MGPVCGTSYITFGRRRQADKEKRRNSSYQKKEGTGEERIGEEKKKPHYYQPSSFPSMWLVNTFCTLRKIKHSISGSYSINTISTYMSVVAPRNGSTPSEEDKSLFW